MGAARVPDLMGGDWAGSLGRGERSDYAAGFCRQPERVPLTALQPAVPAVLAPLPWEG